MHYRQTYREGDLVQCRSCKKPFRITLDVAIFEGPHPQEPDDGRRIEQFNAIHDLIGVIGLHLSGCPAGGQRTDLGGTPCECGMRHAMAWYLKLVPIALATA